MKMVTFSTCFKGLILLTFICLSLCVRAQKLNVAIAGLNHDHIYLIMNSYQKGEVNITGIAEANPELVDRFKSRFKLADSLFYPDLTALLKKKKPDVVLAYNAISDHLAVVETAAPLGISVMVEKPLAMNVKQAQKMAELAKNIKFICLPIMKPLGIRVIRKLI